MELKIDLVSIDNKTGEWVLHLVESDGWGSDQSAAREEKLRNVNQRVHLALDALIDGQFIAAYPDARGQKFRIQIDTPLERVSQLDALILRVNTELASGESVYSTDLQSSEFVSGLRITCIQK